MHNVVQFIPRPKAVSLPPYLQRMAANYIAEIAYREAMRVFADMMAKKDDTPSK